MIRNVLLDADDTLFDFHLSEREALAAALRSFGVEPTPQMIRRYSEINGECWKMLEKKQITRADLLVLRYERLFAEFGLTLSPSAVSDRYAEELGKQCHLIAGAEELLRDLSARYRLYIASNGNRQVQRERLRRAGIGRYLSDVFISQELGADKPDPAYFNACFARIPDFRREQTVIVGDSLTSDIAGGRNAGIRTVWYNPAGAPLPEPAPDASFRRLCELPALLEALAGS